ncbi:MAG: PKD domain-containing protein [Fimbriimonadaceae bacterium]|nr:PKD domain-containing protein [Chitinophagales bacterium]
MFLQKLIIETFIYLLLISPSNNLLSQYCVSVYGNQFFEPSIDVNNKESGSHETKTMNKRFNIVSCLIESSILEIASDAGVSSISEPVSGCGLGTEESIGIFIHNYGGSELSSIPVAYKINGDDEITEIAEVIIEPDEEYFYVFTTTANFSEPGEYLLEAYSLLSPDFDNSNDTLIYTVNSLITPEHILAEDIHACHSAILDAGNTGSTYLWNIGETSQTIETHASGIFSVVIANPKSGCSITDSISVTINNAPEASFISVVTGSGVTLTNTTINTGSCAWDFGDGSVSTENDPPIYTYSENGTYTITLTVMNECGTSVYSDEIVITDVSISDNIPATIKLYPNPAGEILIVELDNLIGETAILEFSNITGEIIFRTEVIVYAKTLIDVSPFPDDIYEFTIKYDAGTISQKFLIMEN